MTNSNTITPVATTPIPLPLSTSLTTNTLTSGATPLPPPNSPTTNANNICGTSSTNPEVSIQEEEGINWMDIDHETVIYCK